jgi:2-hydroxychromene-2-carboxylate isomerase
MGGWATDSHSWFSRNKRAKFMFRNDRKIEDLARLFKLHGMRYVFPHLCPTDAKGYVRD